MMGVMTAAFDPRFGEAWSAAQVLGSLADGDRMGAARAARRRAAVGFTLCRQIGPDAELLLIGVAPAARRSGVGRALLDAAADEARARGAATLFLEVREGNAAGARALPRRRL